MQRRASGHGARGVVAGVGEDDGLEAAVGAAGRLARHASASVAAGGTAEPDARKRRRAAAAASGAGAESDDDMGAAQSASAAVIAVRSPGRGGSKAAASASALPSGSSASGAPRFSLALAPGVERLMAQERTLCEHLQLMPHQYQQIKAAIVGLAVSKGFVRLGDLSSSLIHIGEICFSMGHFLCRQLERLEPVQTRPRLAASWTFV